MKNKTRTILADLSMVMIAMIWGLSFILVKDSISVIPPMQFIGMRFLIATLVMALIFRRHLLKTNKKEILVSCYIGTFLFLAFFAQTIGLQYTTPGKSGFITGLYIVLVPFLASIYYKKFVGWIAIWGAGIAFTGLSFLSISPEELYLFGKGDLYTLAGALAYAMQILAIEKYINQFNLYVLSTVQIGFTAVLSIAYAGFFEPVTVHIPSGVWSSLVFTALISTCVGFLVQNLAQKYTSSTHAALLLGLEAPFALLFSVFLWGEYLSLRGILGCALIFSAILIIEIGPSILGWVQVKKEKKEVLAE